MFLEEKLCCTKAEDKVFIQLCADFINQTTLAETVNITRKLKKPLSFFKNRFSSAFSQEAEENRFVKKKLFLRMQIFISFLSCLFVSSFVFYFAVPKGIFPMGNSGCFPREKPVDTESRYPTLLNY